MQSGELFRINLFAGASTGAFVDGILAEAGPVNWRRPYMSDRTMHAMINREQIHFKDDHLSRLSAQVHAASGSAMTLSHRPRERFFQELYRYREKVVLRPVGISNSPEVIQRLGVIAINTAIEVDISGHEPHLLDEAFAFHQRFMARGNMGG